jgi:hypothetical protein
MRVDDGDEAARRKDRRARHALPGRPCRIGVGLRRARNRDLQGAAASVRQHRRGTDQMAHIPVGPRRVAAEREPGKTETGTGNHGVPLQNTAEADGGQLVGPVDGQESEVAVRGEHTRVPRRLLGSVGVAAHPHHRRSGNHMAGGPYRAASDPVAGAPASGLPGRLDDDSTARVTSSPSALLSTGLPGHLGVTAPGHQLRHQASQIWVRSLPRGGTSMPCSRAQARTSATFGAGATDRGAEQWGQTPGTAWAAGSLKWWGEAAAFRGCGGV